MRVFLSLMLLGAAACGKANDEDGSCPEGNLLEEANVGCTCGDAVFADFIEGEGCTCDGDELLCTMEDGTMEDEF